VTGDRATVERIREMASIAEAVASYTPIRSTGAKHSALCPLPGHKEKTASFTLDDHQGLFYCFGCGRGGDIFKFYMLMENWTFPETLEFLARKYGIPIVRREPKPGELGRGAVEQILDAVLALYKRHLEAPGNPAAAYLENRAVARDLWAPWGLGYAPAGYDTLKRALGSKFSESDLMQAGVLVKGDKGTYDRFRNRLMFAIRDATGRLVGLAGRAFGDDPPKYLNTAETAAFKKGSLLYALDRARRPAGEAGYVLVVEGYFDCIRLHAAGFETAVATMGTALSPAHGQLIKRTCSAAVLCFDGDSAGQNAARSALKHLLPLGLGVELIFLNPADDPDSLIAREGPEAFGRLLDTRRDFFDFFYGVEFSTPPSRLSPVEKSRRARILMEMLNLIPDPILQITYVSRLSERTGIPALVLQKALKAPVQSSAETALERELPDAEKVFLSKYLRDEGCRKNFKGRFHVGLFEAEALQHIAERLIKEGVDKWADFSHIMQEGYEIPEQVAELLLLPDRDFDIEHSWRVLQAKFLRRESALLKAQIAQASPGEMDALLRRKNEIIREIQGLMGKGTK